VKRKKNIASNFGISDNILSTILKNNILKAVEDVYSNPVYYSKRDLRHQVFQKLSDFYINIIIQRLKIMSCMTINPRKVVEFIKN